jgi:hypothetical protein
MLGGTLYYNFDNVIELTEEFSQVVGIGDARIGSVPPVYHHSLFAGAPQLVLA